MKKAYMKPEAKKIDFHYNAVIAQSGCTIESQHSTGSVGQCTCTIDPIDNYKP